MARLVVQKSTGEDFKVFNISHSNLRNSPHSLLSIASTIQELLKALDELLEIEERADGQEKRE